MTKPCPETFHGSMSGYRYYRCRCLPCRMANRDRMRGQRRGRRKRDILKRVVAYLRTSPSAHAQTYADQIEQAWLRPVAPLR